MTTKKQEKVDKLYVELKRVGRINAYTTQALTGNIPKKKKAKYLPVLVEANLKLRIAMSNFNIAFEKLNDDDKAKFKQLNGMGAK